MRLCATIFLYIESKPGAFIIQKDHSGAHINSRAYNFSAHWEDNIVAAAGIVNVKPHRVVMYGWMGSRATQTYQQKRSFDVL